MCRIHRVHSAATRSLSGDRELVTWIVALISIWNPQNCRRSNVWRHRELIFLSSSVHNRTAVKTGRPAGTNSVATGLIGRESAPDSGSPEPVSGTVAANDRRIRQTPFRQQRHSRVPLQRRSKDSAQVGGFGSVACSSRKTHEGCRVNCSRHPQYIRWPRYFPKTCNAVQHSALPRIPCSDFTSVVI